jgi:hypothetical protein
MGAYLPHGCDTQPERWVLKLKAAYEAGYYKTEAAPDEQSGFPWQNKTCQDCAFWSNNRCQLYSQYRGPATDTCTCLDSGNQSGAQRMPRDHSSHGLRRWWEWLKGARYVDGRRSWALT